MSARERLLGEDLVEQVAYHLASRDLLLHDWAGLDYVVHLYRDRARQLLAAAPSSTRVMGNDYPSCDPAGTEIERTEDNDGWRVRLRGDEGLTWTVVHDDETDVHLVSFIERAMRRAARFAAVLGARERVFDRG